MTAMGEGWLMGEERRITEAEEVGKRKRNDLTLKVMGWGEGGLHTRCRQGPGGPPKEISQREEKEAQ